MAQMNKEIKSIESIVDYGTKVNNVYVMIEAIEVDFAMVK